MKHSVLKSAACALGLFALALPASTAALAGPVYTFSTSTGVQPGNVGTITLTQNGANSVNVNVDLLSSTYGFLNSGGPHTPFAFNLSGSGALSIAFTTPAGGSYTNSFNNSGTFLLNTAGGDNTAVFGHFNVAIDDTAGNGSSKAYYGDLLFTLTRTGGLSTDDFIANDGGYYFSADLTDGTSTGAQGWNTRQDPPGDPRTPVPEPLTMSLFGAGLAGMMGLRRRKNLQLA